jgi:membrane fusion protein (multidrug efflux system)
LGSGKEENSADSGNGRRKKIAIVFFALLFIVGIGAVLFYMEYQKTHISTDDAFVSGRVHVIASKVYGTVQAVHFDDNKPVKKGDLLVEIDPADQNVKVRESGAMVEAEKSKLVETRDRVEVAGRQLAEAGYRLASARANLNLQVSNLGQAELDLKRAEKLIRKEVISQDRMDRTKTAYDVALARVETAREQLKQAEASLETQKALIRQAKSSLAAQSSMVGRSEAALKAEMLKQGYTKLYAPADGLITRKSVEVGNQIQPGQPLMAVVPLDDTWIVANYKETQLAGVRPGQKVRISVDTYSGKSFEGVVDSIMAGTGSAFSLFPPENATGNYVKIVQRIPVKIVLRKGADPDHILRVGMSVVPTILVEK